MPSEDSDHPTGASEGPECPDNAVEAVLSRFREAWFSGERPDVDLFCQNHPECAPGLREEIEDFLFAAEGLPGGGKAGLGKSPGALFQGDDVQGKILGDFRILRTLGQGGMGTVYEAEQLSAHRTVALKVLKPGLMGDTTSVRRFRREAQVAQHLSHPHMVEVFGAGCLDDVFYTIMELVEGEPLTDVIEWSIEASGTMPHAGACRTWAGRFAGVARALHHAHEAGVIHRDVKPSNILVNADGLLRLTDFGIARPVGAETLTASSAILGTPLYMAPEQAEGRSKAVEPATDIYSFGATLYETVTGKPSVDAADGGYATVINAILTRMPQRPRRLNAALPRDLETVLLKCLEKRPSDRFASAAILAEELERVAAGRKITTRPVSRLRRTGRWVRRKPAVAVAAASVILALAVCVFMLAGPATAPVPPAESWDELSIQAWLNLLAATTSASWKSMDARLDAWQPTTHQEKEEVILLRAWRAIKRQDIPGAMRLLDEGKEFTSPMSLATLKGFAFFVAGRGIEAKKP